PDAGEAKEAWDDLSMLKVHLDNMGLSDFHQFDPSIVRGLAYYTGIVFEVHDTRGECRALCGGGRYDNLLADFGGPSIPATGMGMGDCVLEILLREKGLLKKQIPKSQLDFLVACVPGVTFDDQKGNVKSTAEDEAERLKSQLVTKGFSAVFSYKYGNLGKQLKEASERNAEKCVIIGEEFKDNKLAVKDMATGEQELVDVDEFLSRFGSD
ncbi:MAG: ATP phosphoribosyltransferase regulatory subunit, partial [Planctomycetota bacterium]